MVEQDADLRATGGYKLHLGPRAVDAAQFLLPGHLMQSLQESSVRTQGFEIHVRDHKGRLLLRGREDEPGESLDVDRITLRLLLAAGLQPVLRTGFTSRRYEQTADGVSLYSAQGERVDGDVLVIADGVNSPTMQQLAAAPTAYPTGLVGIAGRTDTFAVHHDTRALLRDKPMLAIGPAGVGLFASWHDPRSSRQDRPTQAIGAGASGPVIIWGLIATADQFAESFQNWEGHELAALAHDLLQSRRWTLRLAQLPARSRPQGVAGFRFMAADPEAIATWESQAVTALGDAAHAMPPTGGQGAGTALRDAAALARRLTDADHGHTTLPDALCSYQIAMRSYAPQAVRESLQPVRWITAGAHPVGRTLTAAALPAAAAVAAARRHLTSPR